MIRYLKCWFFKLKVRMIRDGGVIVCVFGFCLDFLGCCFFQGKLEFIYLYEVRGSFCRFYYVFC